MKWLRFGALVMGFLFGTIFLIFIIGKGFDGIPGLYDALLLLFGPVTMILGTIIALKWEIVGGIWLIIGAVITSILFGIKLYERPMNLVITSLVYPIPMLIAGILWLAHSSQTREYEKV